MLAAAAGPGLANPAHGFAKQDESRRHAATFMQWPANRAIYDDPVFLGMLQKSVAAIANAIAAFEPVIMLADSALHASARNHLRSDITLWNIPTDDLWCRDSGPCFVKNTSGQRAVAQFNFNGWGNKQSHRHDGAIAHAIAQRLALPEIETGLVGEPGGFEHDGAGTVLAHESSWVNTNRNPHSRDIISQKLKDALGAAHIIWAPGLKDHDITDYHIDALARLASAGQAIIQLPGKTKKPDAWERAAYETAAILKNAADVHGHRMTTTTIPEPVAPRISADDFVASYVNYYICNGAVIMPQFGDKETDAEAQAVIARHYHGRQIVALNIDPIGEVGGGIHCATQEMPE